jgi:hypothetical protein
VAVYYRKTYTESISAAFNQTWVIAIALYQILTLLLSKYTFVDGDILVHPNSRHVTFCDLHRLRNRFTTTEQADDYLYALEERQMDWLIQQPFYKPVLDKIEGSQKPPRNHITKRYFYTLEEARQISKREFQDESYCSIFWNNIICAG